MEKDRTLLDDLPGAVYQCLNDEAFTLLEFNQGFRELFGFSREEISRRFQNSFLEMIHPEDRAAVRRDTAGQLRGGGRVTLHYRVLCRDGGCKWVMDNAQLIRDGQGRERIMCVLMDETENRNDREDLRLSLERYQIILEQTSDVIFEWDVRADTLICSANWAARFGGLPARSGVSAAVFQDPRLHPEDRARLTEMMQRARTGAARDAEVDFRVENAQGRYAWCRVRATNQYDESGRPLRVMGIITDIDKEKRLVDDLRRRAERDPLTGLYNHRETERRIRAHLESGAPGPGALLMIDVDDFKQVNDGQGHLFGDAVLSELAGGIKKLIRRTDVAGRIGGDEFAVFLKDIPSREALREKAQSLLDEFCRLFGGEPQSAGVSCSIGAALCPDHGEDYQTLRRAADAALYEAKSRGKSRFVLFDAPGVRAGEAVPGAGSGRREGVFGDLVSRVFCILCGDSDADRAIRSALELTGRRLGAGCAYIVESGGDGECADVTCAWCGEGVPPREERRFSQAALDGCEALFEEEAVFYCRDVRALPPGQAALFEGRGVRSALWCAIREGSAFRGFVGFDGRPDLRPWSREEASALSLAAQMLAAFLQKERACRRDRLAGVRLSAVLDAQDACLYVVDKSSRELLYLNRKSREQAPAARTGLPCYRALFGRDRPCGTCPLSGAGERFDPKSGVWTSARAFPMSWGEREAYLVSCADVTQYHRPRETRE